MSELKITLSPGRPPDVKIEHAVIRAVEELELATPEAIRRKASDLVGRQVSWNTVVKYLKKAQTDGKLGKRVLSNQKRHMTAFFVTNNYDTR